MTQVEALKVIQENENIIGSKIKFGNQACEVKRFIIIKNDNDYSVEVSIEVSGFIEIKMPLEDFKKREKV